MRRNRPIGPKRPRKGLRRRGIRKPALRRLILANNLLDEEEYAQAGAVFEELGIAAIRRNVPRAPQMFFQAGKAFLSAGNKQKGMDLLIKGLKLMPRMGQHRRIPTVGRRILSGLNEMQMHEEYRAFEGEIDQLLDKYDLRRDLEAEQQSEAILPPKCPFCGGTVHPDEVEWINEQTVECNYCGSVVEGAK